MLITGASRGIGAATARLAARAGYDVVVNFARDEAAAESVVNDCRALGAQAVIHRADVADETQVVGMFERTVEEFGRVDVLVNNAGNAGVDGFTERRPFAETDPSEWEPFLRVNLYGVMNCTRAALPGMVERQWGRIVTIVSDAGRTGDPNGAAYAASKAGAAGLTRSIALENGRHGITANNIALGTMRTPLSEPLWADHADSPQAKAVLRNYVIRRPGTPEDVAGLAVLLASEHGTWVAGQTIPVNGGFSFGL